MLDTVYLKKSTLGLLGSYLQAFHEGSFHQTVGLGTGITVSYWEYSDCNRWQQFAPPKGMRVKHACSDEISLENKL